MKSFERVIWTIAFFVIFGVMSNNWTKSDQTKDRYIASLESNQNLLLDIVSENSIWYIVDKNTISSKPDEQGKIIALDRPILVKQTVMNTDRPNRNRRIKLVTKSSPGFSEAYTICRGLLSYIYLPNE